MARNWLTWPHSATVTEALRLSYGVSSRLQRVPHEPLFYTGSFKGRTVELKIPAGTAIGMTNYLVHANPEIFPEPEKFIPERWLDEKGRRDRSLDGYLLSFSKGSRQCLGMK
jgi:cytochrome P450